MRGKETLWKQIRKLWTMLLLAVLFVGAMQVKAEENPTLILGGEAIAISESTDFYFTPKETRGYAIHLEAENEKEMMLQMSITWQYYNGSGWVSDAYNSCYALWDDDLDEYILNMDYAHYLQKDVQYRIDVHVLSIGNSPVKVSIKESNEAGIYNDMIYRIDIDNEGRKYVTIVSYEGNDAEVTIPGEINGYPVEIIDDRAFENSSTIQTLHISENVKRFDNMCFYGCRNLKKVELPSTLCEVFDQNPFEDCPIEEITFPNGSEYGYFTNQSLVINDILLGYFGNNTEEYHVPDGVIKMGAFCFSEDIKKVYLPKSVNYIGSWIFDEMEGLEECHISNASCMIERGAFYYENKYNVIIYSQSDGLLEQLCEEQGIPFISEGKMDPYFVLEEGKDSRAGVYKDGKFHCSFVPSTSKIYKMSAEFRGAYTGVSGWANVPYITNAAGEEVPFVTSGGHYYAKLEAGKIYYLTADSENRTYYECMIRMETTEDIYETLSIFGESINEEPATEAEIEAGIQVTLRIEVASYFEEELPISIQWFRQEMDENGDIKYVEITGAVSKEYEIASLEEDSVYKCVASDAFYTKEVEFSLRVKEGHEHQPVTDPAVTPTCTTSGLTEGSHCSICQMVLKEQTVIPAKGHVWNDGVITKEPTQTETGIKTYTCLTCGETKYEVLDKLPPTTEDTKPSDPTTPTNPSTQPSQPSPSAQKPQTQAPSAPASNPAPAVGTTLVSSDKKAVYKITGSNTVEYTKAASNKAKVTIPSTVTYQGRKYQVTSIGAKAFRNSKKLKKVVIPSTVRKIGKQAFANCKKLKSITIKTNKLSAKTIGNKAFKGINAKATIKVPKKKLKLYKKILRAKGVSASAKIK